MQLGCREYSTDSRYKVAKNHEFSPDSHHLFAAPCLHGSDSFHDLQKAVPYSGLEKPASSKPGP